MNFKYFNEKEPCSENTECENKFESVTAQKEESRGYLFKGKLNVFFLIIFEMVFCSMFLNGINCFTIFKRILLLFNFFLVFFFLLRLDYDKKIRKNLKTDFQFRMIWTVTRELFLKYVFLIGIMNILVVVLGLFLIYESNSVIIMTICVFFLLLGVFHNVIRVNMSKFILLALLIHGVSGDVLYGNLNCNKIDREHLLPKSWYKVLTLEFLNQSFYECNVLYACNERNAFRGNEVCRYDGREWKRIDMEGKDQSMCRSTPEIDNDFILSHDFCIAVLWKNGMKVEHYGRSGSVEKLLYYFHSQKRNCDKKYLRSIMDRLVYGNDLDDIIVEYDDEDGRSKIIEEIKSEFKLYRFTVFVLISCWLLFIGHKLNDRNNVILTLLVWILLLPCVFGEYIDKVNLRYNISDKLSKFEDFGVTFLSYKFGVECEIDTVLREQEMDLAALGIDKWPMFAKVVEDTDFLVAMANCIEDSGLSATNYNVSAFLIGGLLTYSEPGADWMDYKYFFREPYKPNELTLEEIDLINEGGCPLSVEDYLNDESGLRRLFTWMLALNKVTPVYGNRLDAAKAALTCFDISLSLNVKEGSGLVEAMVRLVMNLKDVEDDNELTDFIGSFVNLHKAFPFVLFGTDFTKQDSRKFNKYKLPYSLVNNFDNLRKFGLVPNELESEINAKMVESGIYRQYKDFMVRKDIRGYMDKLSERFDVILYLSDDIDIEEVGKTIRIIAGYTCFTQHLGLNNYYKFPYIYRECKRSVLKGDGYKYIPRNRINSNKNTRFDLIYGKCLYETKHDFFKHIHKTKRSEKDYGKLCTKSAVKRFVSNRNKMIDYNIEEDEGMTFSDFLFYGFTIDLSNAESYKDKSYDEIWSEIWSDEMFWNFFHVVFVSVIGQGLAFILRYVKNKGDRVAMKKDELSLLAYVWIYLIVGLYIFYFVSYKDAVEMVCITVMYTMFYKSRNTMFMSLAVSILKLVNYILIFFNNRFIVAVISMDVLMFIILFLVMVIDAYKSDVFGRFGMTVSYCISYRNILNALIALVKNNVNHFSKIVIILLQVIIYSGENYDSSFVKAMDNLTNDKFIIASGDSFYVLLCNIILFAGPLVLNTSLILAGRRRLKTMYLAVPEVLYLTFCGVWIMPLACVYEIFMLLGGKYTGQMAVNAVYILMMLLMFSKHLYFIHYTWYFMLCLSLTILGLSLGYLGIMPYLWVYLRGISKVSIMRQRGYGDYRKQFKKAAIFVNNNKWKIKNTLTKEEQDLLREVQDDDTEGYKFMGIWDIATDAQEEKMRECLRERTCNVIGAGCSVGKGVIHSIKNGEGSLLTLKHVTGGEPIKFVPFGSNNSYRAVKNRVLVKCYDDEVLQYTFNSGSDLNDLPEPILGEPPNPRTLMIMDNQEKVRKGVSLPVLGISELEPLPIAVQAGNSGGPVVFINGDDQPVLYGLVISATEDKNVPNTLIKLPKGVNNAMVSNRRYDIERDEEREELAMIYSDVASLKKLARSKEIICDGSLTDLYCGDITTHIFTDVGRRLINKVNISGLMNVRIDDRIDINADKRSVSYSEIHDGIDDMIQSGILMTQSMKREKEYVTKKGVKDDEIKYDDDNNGVLRMQNIVTQVNDAAVYLERKTSLTMNEKKKVLQKYLDGLSREGMTEKQNKAIRHWANIYSLVNRNSSTMSMKYGVHELFSFDGKPDDGMERRLNTLIREVQNTRSDTHDRYGRRRGGSTRGRPHGRRGRGYK